MQVVQRRNQQRRGEMPLTTQVITFMNEVQHEAVRAARSLSYRLQRPVTQTKFKRIGNLLLASTVYFNARRQSENRLSFSIKIGQQRWTRKLSFGVAYEMLLNYRKALRRRSRTAMLNAGERRFRQAAGRNYVPRDVMGLIRKQFGERIDASQINQ